VNLTRPLQRTPQWLFRFILSAKSAAPPSSGVKRRVKTSGSILLVTILLLGAYATQDLLRPLLARRASSAVHIGDSKSQVEAALGEPTRTRPAASSSPNFSLGFPQPVLWCYGHKLEYHHPPSRQFPYVVGMVSDWSFYPEPDDVVIEFNGRGRVVSMHLPKP
jgi:hypothetical protein